MSGLEAGAAIFGLLAGAIDITHKAFDIYRAVEDKSGIPRTLKKVSEKLPLVERILKDAEIQCKRVETGKTNEQTWHGMEREVEKCKELCQEMHNLLLGAYPKAGSGKAGRLWKGTKTVCSSKGNHAERLLEDIRTHLELLASRQIICNAASLGDLRSLVDDIPKRQELTQQQPALLLPSHKYEDHDCISMRDSDILQSWILRSHGRTSSLVSLDSSGRTRFERICRRISNYDPKAIHRRLSARKAAGTNRWLLDRDDFQSWLRGDTNPQSHLWLSGKVGSGKSTLVTTVVDECLAKRKPGDSSAVLMFFFQGHQHTALLFFESLTKQLIDALVGAGIPCSTEVLSSLESAYGREVARPGIEQVVYDLVAPLCSLLQNSTLVIDGIEECKTTERNLVWQWLDKFLGKVSVKLVITSEGWTKISLPNKDFLQIRVDQHNKADIDTYIHEQITSRSGPGQIFGDEQLRADARLDLQQKADGMFLWIYLVLQIILEDCDSPHDVKMAVRSLPSDLEAIYSHCLTRKRKSRRPSDTNLLIWVCAAPNPLDVHSLRELLAMDLETGHLSPDKMPAEELLVQSGGGLVTLDIAAQLVLPVHSTVRKFVFSEQAHRSMSASAASSESWPLFIETGRWNEAMFRSALGSLCLFHIEQRTTRSPALSSKPTTMRVPPPDLPKIWRQLIPTRFNPKAADVSINLSPFRLRPNQISGNTFLRYALDNWLICNKELGSDSEDFPWMQETSDSGCQTSTELFENIATERNESFDIHPWPSVPGSSNSHMSNMFAYAVVNGHLPLLKIVKSNGRVPVEVFDLPLAQHGQMLAVHVAAKKGLVSVLCELAEVCSLSAVCLSTGRTALHFAAESGSVGCLDVLLGDRRLDLNARDKEGRSALFLAASGGYDEFVNILQGTGRVKIDAKDKDGLTPLWWASTHGHDKVVEVLLETIKIEIDAQDEHSRTSLSQAAKHGHERVVHLLIETGKARVNVKDKEGLTPLSHAAKNGHCKVVEVLLRSGKAEVEATDSYRCTPLVLAAMSGHDKVVEMLLVMGKAEVDAIDLDGWNALFHAADSGHEKVVEVLLLTGEAEVDGKDRSGVTPLWWAVEEGHFDVVEVLLETGKADLDVKKTADMTLSSLAVKKGHYRVARRLREALEGRGNKVHSSQPAP